MSIDQELFAFFRDNRGLPFRTMTVFNFLLEATLFGSLLILLVLLLRAVLRKKLGNRAIYVAWLLVAIRLLVPLALPNPMMNELRPTWSEDLAARPVADQVRVRAHDALSGLSWQLYDAAYSGEETNQVLADAANVAYNVNVVSSYGWLGKWIFFAYLAVDGAVLVCMAVQNIRFRRRLRAGKVSQIEGEELALYHALCKERGVKPIPVWYVDPLPSACLVGVVKPYIALPLTLTKEELSQVLTHELCHQKAGDNWWGMVRNLCCIVHWFNPLVWLAARCSRTDCELACDERVTEKMDREQRVAYAGTLVLAAARRNAPGMSVLATGMTMTGKRLKQRVKAIVQNRKKLVWLAAALLVGLAVVTVGAFFTAERFEEGYDVRMRKALPRFSLDGNMPVVVPQNVAFSQRPITTEEEALAYARELLATPYLGMQQEKDVGPIRISSFEGEWRAELPEAPYGFELYFDSNGTLLYWDECLPLASEDYPYEMELVQQPVDAYIRQFAKDCLGDPAIAYVRIDEQRYTLEQRYIYGRAVAEGDKGLFTFALEPYGMTLTGFHAVTRTTFGDGTFFSHAVSNLRNWLFSHTDITAKDLAAGRITVEAVGEEGLLTAYTVSADKMSSAFLQSARNEQGERDEYTYQLVTDRYGADTGYRTGEAYLRREEPVITQAAAMEAAVSAAAVIFQTEPLQVSCTTADHYPEHGWYEAYCSHQLGETKELITLRVDDHNGSILSMETVIASRELQLTPQQMKALPAPAAPLETVAPIEEAAEKPDGDTLAFETDGVEHLLPIRLLKDSAMRNDPPGANDLTLEEAGRIAVEAVCAEYGLSYEELTHYYLRGQFITEETVENAPKWWFNLVLQSTNECRYTIGVTSPEGKVEHLGGPGDGNG